MIASLIIIGGIVFVIAVFGPHLTNFVKNNAWLAPILAIGLIGVGIWQLTVEFVNSDAQLNRDYFQPSYHLIIGLLALVFGVMLAVDVFRMAFGY